MTESVLQLAKQSRKENKELYDALGSESRPEIKKQEEEDIIDQLVKLVPKSTEGKVLAGIALIIGLAIFASVSSKK